MAGKDALLTVKNPSCTFQYFMQQFDLAFINFVSVIVWKASRTFLSAQSTDNALNNRFSLKGNRVLIIVLSQSVWIIYSPLFLIPIDPGLEASSGLEGFEFGSCFTL